MRGPVDQQPDMRQVVWEAIRARAGRFWPGDIVVASGAHRKTVSDHLKGWRLAGYVEHLEDGAFRLARDVGQEAPRVLPDGTPVSRGGGTEQMWQTMRILKEFEVVDLLTHGEVPIREATARSYVGMLLQTGYLRVIRKAVPSRGRMAVYRLIRNTGPRPPMIQSVKQVWDPNSQTVYRPGERA